MDNFNTPKETVDNLISIWEAKVNKTFISSLILGILAGAYIWFWAQVATVVATWTPDILGFWLTKLLMWAVFSVALILVIIAWGELFTGNILIIQAKYKRKVTWNQLWKNLIIIYCANFIGALFVAYLIYKANLWTSSDSHLGMTALKIANDKVNIEFIPALIRWIFANWLVCLGVVLAISAKDVIWKIFGIIFPVMTFVACGFEHSIANMYFIPMWLFLKNQSALVVSSWLDITNLTWYNFFVWNLFPVTIGNIIGWAIFVWLFYTITYSKN